MNFVKYFLLCALATPALAAPSDALVFVGQVAPADAFGDARAPATFLRWQVSEGELPPDLVGFELTRDGELIHQAGRQPRPTPAQVAAAYAPYPRRLGLLQASLRAAGEGADVGGAVAARLAADGPADRHWRRLRFAQDPVLATLGGRGYIDRRPGGHTYRLFAVSSGRQRALLGELAVPEGVQRAAAPTAVRQVHDLARCDAPEQGKHHGAVALSWDLPGVAGSADRLAHQSALAGYDVYRAEAPGAPQALDFAALAQTARPGADGAPVIAGLVRVSAVPVAPAPEPQAGADGRITEARFPGWNPAFAQWMETADAVAAMGLAPGDVRAWYVVPRDFTGNYGQAVGLAVTVPDAARPPAPWSARAIPEQTADHAADGLALEWWHVDARNYHDAHPGDRTWCNLDVAAAEGRLRFAGPGATCADPDGQVNVAVAGYRVYRFDNREDAARFVDTDGDGVSDGDERVSLPAAGALARSQPGTACDPDRQPAGAPNRLVAALDAGAVTRRAGRAVVRFADPLGDGVEPARVYWYRLASVGRNGQVSPLSAPVRGLFPDLGSPGRAEPDSVRFGWCAPRAAQVPTQAPTAVDLTGLAVEARYVCAAPKPVWAQQSPVLAVDTRRVAVAPVVGLPDGGRGVLDPQVCAAIPADCDLRVQFVGAAGQVLATAPVADHHAPLDERAGPPVCAFTAQLSQDCLGAVLPVADGQVVQGPVLVETGADGPCVEVLRRIGDRRYRMATLCPPNARWVSEPDAQGGSLDCYELQAVSQHGVIGPATPLGCVTQADPTPPDPPTLTQISPDATGATVRWAAPEQFTAGVLLEWSRADLAADAQGQAGVRFAGHAGRYGPGEPHEAHLDWPAQSDQSERWCVRARSFGRGTDVSRMVSAWSAPQCVVRAPAGAPLPSYLPWPTQRIPPLLGTLPVRYLGEDQLPVIALSDLGQPVVDEADGCVAVPAAIRCDQGACVDDTPRLFGGCDLCGRVDARLGEHRRFVVYRQRRPLAGGSPEAFHQVSPRVDGMFCREGCGDVFGNCKPGQDSPFCDLAAVNEQACLQGVLDPYLKLLSFPEGDPWPRSALVFADRSPHAAGYAYRYQLVYFDSLGEITGRRTTDWVAAPAEGAL